MIVSKEMRPKAVYFPLDCTLFFLSFLCMVLFVWVYIAFIETRFLIRDSVMDLDPGTWEMQAEQETTKQHIMRPMKKQTNEQDHPEVLIICLNTKSCCYLFSWTLI